MLLNPFPFAFAPFLLFIVIVVVAVVAIVLGLEREARRRREIAAAAAGLGLAYEARPTEDLQGRLADMSPFRSGRGGRPRVLNVVRGNYRGVEVRCFDYVCTVQTGKSSHDVWNAVAVAFVPEAWPELTIVPETLGHKVLDALGGDDIDFESEEFSRRFWVRSDDRRFAYDAIHPRMMEFLLAPGWTHWHLRSGVVCLWRPAAWGTARMRPADVAPALERLARFIDLVPAHARGRVAPASGAAPRPLTWERA